MDTKYSNSPSSQAPARRKRKGRGRALGCNRRSGQALIFVVMAVVILLFAALWVADVHRIIFTKDKTQNAGDAAALAAARWQASTLNFQGELNLMHAMALAAGNFAAADVITQTQARLSFTGPLTAVAAAQQGAKLNGMFVNEEFTAFVRERAAQARGEYAAASGGLPEPYPNAWREYASMLSALASDGIAAGIDNAWFFNDPMGAHPLLHIDFYHAIAARDWCFFFLNYPGLLEDYTGHGWWPGLPPPDPMAFSQSELLGVWTQPGAAPLRQILNNRAAYPAAERLGIDIASAAYIDTNTLNRAEFWQFYNLGRWPGWPVMSDPSYPVDGRIASEYEYTGADAVARVEARITRFTADKADGSTGAEDAIIWTGAAKPFGYLDSETDGSRVPPHASHLVLPAFREVRLIPIDASTAPSGGSFNLVWRRHCEQHLPLYLSSGRGVPGCRYCRNIAQWDIPEWRQSGVAWLSTNSWRCTIRPPGGSPGGGSPHAH